MSDKAGWAEGLREQDGENKTLERMMWGVSEEAVGEKDSFELDSRSILVRTSD